MDARHRSRTNVFGGSQPRTAISMFVNALVTYSAKESSYYKLAYDDITRLTLDKRTNIGGHAVIHITKKSHTQDCPLHSPS
jgi:hypothetical protein